MKTCSLLSLILVLALVAPSLATISTIGDFFGFGGPPTGVLGSHEWILAEVDRVNSVYFFENHMSFDVGNLQDCVLPMPDSQGQWWTVNSVNISRVNPEPPFQSIGDFAIPHGHDDPAIFDVFLNHDIIIAVHYDYIHDYLVVFSFDTQAEQFGNPIIIDESNVFNNSHAVWGDAEVLANGSIIYNLVDENDRTSHFYIWENDASTEFAQTQNTTVFTDGATMDTFLNDTILVIGYNNGPSIEFHNDVILLNLETGVSQSLKGEFLYGLKRNESEFGWISGSNLELVSIDSDLNLNVQHQFDLSTYFRTTSFNPPKELRVIRHFDVVVINFADVLTIALNMTDNFRPIWMEPLEDLVDFKLSNGTYVRPNIEGYGLLDGTRRKELTGFYPSTLSLWYYSYYDNELLFQFTCAWENRQSTLTIFDRVQNTIQNGTNYISCEPIHINEYTHLSGVSYNSPSDYNITYQNNQEILILTNIQNYTLQAPNILRYQTFTDFDNQILRIVNELPYIGLVTLITYDYTTGSKINSTTLSALATFTKVTEDLILLAESQIKQSQIVLYSISEGANIYSKVIPEAKVDQIVPIGVNPRVKTEDAIQGFVVYSDSFESPRGYDLEGHEVSLDTIDYGSIKIQATGNNTLSTVSYNQVFFNDTERQWVSSSSASERVFLQDWV